MDGRLQPQLCKFNPKIVIDTDFDLILEGVGCGFEFVLFQEINIYGLIYGIYNPVLPYSSVHVKVQLAYIVMAGSGWRSDFYNPVRCPDAAPIC